MSVVERIIALATAARLPTMFPADSFFYGPMLSYGSSLSAAAGRMGSMVGRILKGAQPGDLSIEVVALSDTCPIFKQIRAHGDAAQSHL